MMRCPDRRPRFQKVVPRNRFLVYKRQDCVDFDPCVLYLYNLKMPSYHFSGMSPTGGRIFTLTDTDRWTDTVIDPTTPDHSESNDYIEAAIKSPDHSSETSKLTHMYEIVANETGEHLGIFSTLKKAKDTVNDLLEGIKGNMVINRIPIDTVSYFDPDTVWETLRHDS